MPPKGWKKPLKREPEEDIEVSSYDPLPIPVAREVPGAQRIAELLRCIPNEVFVDMVSKAGMPTEESRELCALFKGLK